MCQKGIIMNENSLIEIHVNYPVKLPDISIKGLKIWVHDWQFPTGTEGDDEDWLHVTASCEAKNSIVWRNGNFIESSNFSYLNKQLKDEVIICKDHRFGEVYAMTFCEEPYFELKIKYIHLPPSDEDEYGIGESLVMIVNITSELNDQSHQYSWEVSFEELNELVCQLEKLSQKYPHREKSYLMNK